MKNHVLAAIGLTLAASAASAACEANKPGDEVTYEDAQVLYDCLKDDLYAGYQNGPKGWISPSVVADYRNWTPVNTMPANPGFHSSRFLSTWVNDVGAEQYLKFNDVDNEMPAGTIIAKETFDVNAEGKASPGPLFFMEKVAEGVSPETRDWYYYFISEKGAPQAVDVMPACNECHMENFPGSDNLGYPVEEVRVAK